MSDGAKIALASASALARLAQLSCARSTGRARQAPRARRARRRLVQQSRYKHSNECAHAMPLRGAPAALQSMQRQPA